MEMIESLTCSARMLGGSPNQVLTEKMMHMIWTRLPMRLRLRDWEMVYSFEGDGAGINQMYRKLRGLSRRAAGAGCLLLVRQESGDVCGAYASQPWVPHIGAFGTGETFVFHFADPKMDPEATQGRIYTWARTNDFFLTASGGDTPSIGVGGGDGGYALYLDHSLLHASNSSSATFQSPPLAKVGTFKVLQAEVWAFP